jgi:hypothetical protein
VGLQTPPEHAMPREAPDDMTTLAFAAVPAIAASPAPAANPIPAARIRTRFRYPTCMNALQEGLREYLENSKLKQRTCSDHYKFREQTTEICKKA